MKDFIPSKGRDRLLTLNFLSVLPIEDHASSSSHTSSDPPSNAYEFMRKRREVAGDPAIKRWNAQVRLGNYASVENSPLCVSMESCRDITCLLYAHQLSSIGALLDHLVRIKAMSDLDDSGLAGLDIRGIESIHL